MCNDGISNALARASRKPKTTYILAFTPSNLPHIGNMLRFQFLAAMSLSRALRSTHSSRCTIPCPENGSRKRNNPS